MLHNWTMGASGSGKTALNKALCAGLRARGIATVVLDPLRDGGWDADFCTHDVEAFWHWTLKRDPKKLAVFWEEARISVSREDKRFNLAALCGRHDGWRIYLITQRFKHVDPDVRDQCKERWVFNVAAEDAQLLFREYGHKALRDAGNLPPLNFFRIQPFKPLQKGSIKFSRGRSPQLNLTDL